jgi:hypothetical protein
MKWEDWENEMREKRSQAPPLKELETTIHQDIFGEGLRQIGRLQAGETVPLDELSVPTYTRSAEGCEAIVQRLYAAHKVKVRCYIEDFGTHFKRCECVITDAEGVTVGIGQAQELGTAIGLAALEFHRNWERNQTNEAIEKMIGEE